MIGLIAGIIIVFSVEILDRAKLDDPVGAISAEFEVNLLKKVRFEIAVNDNFLEPGSPGVPRSAEAPSLIETRIGSRWQRLARDASA